MDVVTHAMSGLTLAAPLAPHAPVTAACFALGTVLPDLDALSRIFGKIAFLRWHQTCTHALIAPVVVALLAWPILIALRVMEAWAPLALASGMLLHVMLDLTNTYGLTLLAPFSRRRSCLEWVFFIDAPVAVVSAACLAATAIEFATRGFAGPWPAAACGLFFLTYFPIRWSLHRRAWSQRPEGTVSLLPSALVPWRYYGLARNGDEVRLFTVSALGSEPEVAEEMSILDGRYVEALSEFREFRIMREISAGYHVVSAEGSDRGTMIECRDLRTRNFGGEFGRLEVALDGEGRVQRREFHV